MQTKRAVRPSTTSTSSNLRVKSGCTEGCTVSRALHVSSSARRAGTGEPPQHKPVQGRRQPVTPPGCNPATSVAVGEHTPYMVGAEPRCVGFQALSLCRAGGYKCVQGPQAQGWGSDGSRHFLPLCAAVQVPATSWGGRMPCPPHRAGDHSCPIPLGTGQRCLISLNAPGEGISTRDHLAMTVLALVRLGNTILRHTLTSLSPKLLLPSKPHRHTASFMEDCTGTSCCFSLRTPSNPPA